MKNLDDDLRAALRRKEPPAGFAGRVIARAGEGASEQTATSTVGSGFSRIAPPKGGSHVGPPVVRWLAAAAVIAAVAGGAIQYRAGQAERARAERAAGEAAGRQVMLALQIAGSKLQLVQARINRLHEQPDRNATR